MQKSVTSNTNVSTKDTIAKEEIAKISKLAENGGNFNKGLGNKINNNNKTVTENRCNEIIYFNSECDIHKIECITWSKHASNIIDKSK